MVERSVFSYRLEKDNHLLAFDKLNLIKTIRRRGLNLADSKPVKSSDLFRHQIVARFQARQGRQ